MVLIDNVKNVSVNSELLSMALILHHHTKSHVLSKLTSFTRIQIHIDRLNEALESKNQNSTIRFGGSKGTLAESSKQFAENPEISSTISGNRERKRNVLKKT
jgi:hypothetical protein